MPIPFEPPDLPKNEILHPNAGLYGEVSLPCGLYSNLIAYENHYNIIQNKYKALATTWVLATFIGIGYFLSGFESAIPWNIFISIMLLCLLSAEGIFLVWHLDAGIYHKLIEAIFKEVLKLEDQFPLLGRSHHNILKLHEKDHDPLKFHGLFYASFIFFLTTIAALCLVLYLYDINKIYALTASSLFFVAIGFFIFITKRPILFR